jgi:hypothetical protein
MYDSNYSGLVPVSLLKTGNKVVEVGWVHSKVEDEEGTTVGSKLGTST